MALHDSPVIIHDGNAAAFCNLPGVGYGLKKRDMKAQPLGSVAAAATMFPSSLLIPESDWQGLIDQKNADRSWLDDIRNISGPNGGRIPSRNQNGKGYCWAHSTVSAMMLARAMCGLPYADLSAFAIACIIKNYQDQGGNGIDSLQFLAARGCPTSAYWPQQSMSRVNDNPQTWANAAENKVSLWYDCDPAQAKAILVSCALRNIPVVGDYNWWSHSVGSALRIRSLNPFTADILNSWGDSAGTNGIYTLQGNKAIPDNLCVPIVPYASVA
jgi:hypothetical protein